MRTLLPLICLCFLSSCAYKMGYGYRDLPRGIKSIHVPVFKNDTLEVGPEADFTNQLVREFRRANVGKLAGLSEADGILQGRITRITRTQRSHESRGRGENKTFGMKNLPEGTYVATEYELKIAVNLNLKSRESGKTVWTQRIQDQTVYSTSRLALEGINTSSANYTSSEEERVIKELASVMMREAVDRLTEKF